MLFADQDHGKVTRGFRVEEESGIIVQWKSNRASKLRSHSTITYASTGPMISNGPYLP